MVSASSTKIVLQKNDLKNVSILLDDDSIKPENMSEIDVSFNRIE